VYIRLVNTFIDVLLYRKLCTLQLQTLSLSVRFRTEILFPILIFPMHTPSVAPFRFIFVITPKVFRVHIKLQTSNGFTLFMPCFIMKRNTHVTPSKAVFCNLIKVSKMVTVSVNARLL